MSWREDILAHAAQGKHPTVVAPEGIGIEFADGCDAFWVLPGEVTSSVPVGRDVVDSAALIEAFERINRPRTWILQVIRHDLAEREISVDRRCSGEWGVMTTSGVSSSVSVGPSLTARIGDEPDIHRLLASCYEGTILGEPPDSSRVERYLATEGPPPGERPWPDETPTIGFTNNLRWVLLMTGVCRAVEDEANLTSPEKLAAAAAPTGRLGRTLLHLADRLPQIRASFELTSRSIDLEFDDGEDSLRIPPRPRELSRRVRTLGVEGAADQLADEYLRLNDARRTVLDAVRHAACHLGWGVHRWSPILRSGDESETWFLGRTRREVKLLVGQPLTDLLRTEPPEAAIRHLLAPYPAFAEACVAGLAIEESPPPLPDRDLATEPPDRRPRLRPLDPATLAELDAFADRTLAAYLRNERTSWDYRRTDRFDPERDTWATTADWVRLAERLIDGDWPNPAALLVLLDAGDPRGSERARSLLARSAPHHEVSDAEVELAWRFRHEMPEIARQWFAPQPFDQMPYAEQRARLGDPVARRYFLANEGFAIDEETTWSERTDPALSGLWPSPSVLDRVRLGLVEWARTIWKWSPGEPLELQKARWLGLGEVADALDENEYLTNGLLCGDRRHGLFDEPGILMGADLLLAWSRLKPTRLLAQVVATAQTGEVLAEAERIGRESAERKPAVRAHLAITLEAYRCWWEDLQVPLAITWKRCRASLAFSLVD